MKPYTETQLQLNFSSWRILKHVKFGDVKDVDSHIHLAYNEGARYVEAELLPEVINQHKTIERLQKENNELKDKIVKLTSDN